MKTLHHNIVLVLLALALAGCIDKVQAERKPFGNAPEEQRSGKVSDNRYRRYGIESAVVTSVLTGNRTGTDTLYFDRWGMREARYTHTAVSVAGITNTSSTLTLTDTAWIYTIDLNRRTGTKVNNTVMENLLKRSGARDLIELGEQMMKNMGGKIIGSETVAGKPCDLWEIKGISSRTWLWQWISLKTSASMAGIEVTTTATGIIEGPTIPEERFIIPADVTITAGTSLQDLRNIRNRRGGKP